MHFSWTHAAGEAIGGAAVIGAAIVIDAIEHVRHAGRVRETEPEIDELGVAKAPANRSATFFGSPRFLWSSVATLAAICRAKRDGQCLRTAAKVALAIGAAHGLANASRALSRSMGGGRARGAANRRHPGGPARALFSAPVAAAWAAAGVLERAQGKGPGYAAYSAAALAGYARSGDRRGPIADLVAGAVVGRLVGRLVGQLRIP